MKTPDRLSSLKSKTALKRISTLLTAFVGVAVLASVFVYVRVFAATTYTWNQTGTASWATSTNWTPTRTTPAVDDVLVFNNGALVARARKLKLEL